MNFLKKKLGPLPVWVYGLVVVGAGAFWYFYWRPAHASGTVPDTGQPTPGNLGPISAGYAQAASAYGTGTGPIIVASPTQGNTGLNTIGQQSPSFPQTAMMAIVQSPDPSKPVVPLQSSNSVWSQQAGTMTSGSYVQITGPAKAAAGATKANPGHLWYPLGPDGAGPYVRADFLQFKTSGSPFGMAPIPTFPQLT